MYGLRGMVIRFRLLTRKKYKYTIWQSTDGDGGGYLNTTKGLVAGIPSYSVDIDFGYVDYTKIITSRWHAQTGYKASTRPDTSNYKGKNRLGNRERKRNFIMSMVSKNTAGFR